MLISILGDIHTSESQRSESSLGNDAFLFKKLQQTFEKRQQKEFEEIGSKIQQILLQKDLSI